MTVDALDGPVLGTHRHPLRASLLAVAAGTVWSFGAVTAKSAKGADAWQYLMWRSIGVIVMMELLHRRKRLRNGPLTLRAFRSGWPMFLASCCLGLASVAYVYALKATTAANTSLFSSLSPLVAAILAAWFLREHITIATVVAILVAFVGLLVMVNGSAPAGSPNSTLGNASALLSAVGFGGYAVCLRTSKVQDWSAVLPGYASMAIVLCATVALAQGHSLAPSFKDCGLAMMHGGVFIVIGTIMFNAATREVPAAAMAVFAQTETVFAPVWVYFVIHEEPATATLIGGSIILAAVIGNALVDSYFSKPAWRWKTRLSQ